MDAVQINNTIKRIRYFKDILQEKKTVFSERLENILGLETGYKKGKNFPDLQNFSPFHEKDRWSFKNDAHFLFYMEFKTPPVEENERCELRILTDNDKRNPQFIVYENVRRCKASITNIKTSFFRRIGNIAFTFTHTVVLWSTNPILSIRF